MVYSFTQISQYLRCSRSYRYRYLDGWREKETRASMVLDAPLKMPWARSSGVKTPVQRFLPNGEITVMPLLDTRKVNPGIASFIKAFNCSNGLRKMTVFGFTIH
jgi:hypothetical protein